MKQAAVWSEFSDLTDLIESGITEHCAKIPSSSAVLQVYNI